MFRRLASCLSIFVCAVGLIAVLDIGAAAQQTPRSDVPPMSPADFKAVADRYCVSCHNDRLKTGGLSLQQVDFSDIPAHAEPLEKALRKIMVGAMPPLGAPKPERATLTAWTAGVSSALDKAADAKADPGRAILRRLNRTEYANAIRDLLGIEVDVNTLLPFDDSSHGFDNIADVLGMSPLLMERYLVAARRISAVAVGDAIDIATTADTYRVKPDLSQDRHLEGLPLGTRGGSLVTHLAPLDGEYTLKFKLRQATLNNVVGMEYPHTFVVLVDGAEVHRATLGGKEDLTTSFANSQGSAEVFEARLATRVKLSAGPHQIGAAFLEKSAALRSGMLQPFLRTTWDPVNYTGEPHIETMVVTGPFSPGGPGDTPSRRRLFTCRPASPSGEEACASTILTTLARKAYRRPITDADTRGLMTFFRLGRDAGSFDSGIAMGVRRILASPDFVFRVERDPAGAPAGTTRRVTDVELASRLSFFLWSTLPDDELLRLAGQGRLSDRGTLERQVRRMLADPRSRALVDNFAGQWLYLRNLRNINPAPDEFPDFDHNLRLAMAREVEMLFESVIREDRGVGDLMTARDTFVNERLARHYGIANISGSHFRRITLTQPERYGLLGKGAILLVTSLPTRTSPVIRGKWILENLVGTPPPPPPGVVPPLEDEPLGQAPRSLRERTEIHRRNPACAACHKVMDPIGFALEPFDAVGRWRVKDSGAPIDAKGQLMDGSTVDGPTTLREALTRNPDVFARTMTDKLMIYALGRGLEANDIPTIRRIVREASRDGYRFSALVTGIVTSTPFRMKRVAAASAPAAE
jgi:hypothetical protein